MHTASLDTPFRDHPDTRAWISRQGRHARLRPLATIKPTFSEVNPAAQNGEPLRAPPARITIPANSVRYTRSDRTQWAAAPTILPRSHCAGGAAAGAAAQPVSQLVEPSPLARIVGAMRPGQSQADK